MTYRTLVTNSIKCVFTHPFMQLIMLYITVKHDNGLEVLCMKQMAQNDNAGFGLDEFSTISDFIRNYALDLIKPQNQESPRTAPDAIGSLEKAKESLVYAYLAANLNFKNIPLKEFMDDLEKNILLSCLHLTQGSQMNTADMLSLKPTALSEKMRKHGINGKRIKLSTNWRRRIPKE